MKFQPYKAIQEHNKDLNESDPGYISDERLMEALYPYKAYKAKKKKYDQVPSREMWRLANYKNIQNFKNDKKAIAHNNVVTILVEKFGISLCSLWR